MGRLGLKKPTFGAGGQSVDTIDLMSGDLVLKAAIELTQNITFGNFTQSKVSLPFNGIMAGAGTTIESILFLDLRFFVHEIL